MASAKVSEWPTMPNQRKPFFEAMYCRVKDVVMRVRSIAFFSLLILISCESVSRAMPVNRTSADDQARTGSVAAEIGEGEDGEAREVRARSPGGISEAYFSCVMDAGHAALQSAACISQEIDVQDERLNRTYRELLKKVDNDAHVHLVEAQRAWM